MKSWLEKNDIEMCLTHIEGKSVVAERLIRIKILNLKLLILLEYENVKNKKKHFAIVYTPNQSEKVFVIKKVKHTVPWT